MAAAPQDVVIDADVMRSAGASDHPISSSSREALNAIRAGGHRMVSSGPIREEHKKHSGKFAKTWQASMYARRQVVAWTYVADQDLRNRLAQAFPPEATAQRDAALKDTHLLEAATASGQRIVSRDFRAKTLFQSVCHALRQHGCQLWADLTVSPDGAIEWLKAGLPGKEEFRLCAAPSKKTKRQRKRG